MPIVILKSFSGSDYALKSGKVVSLKGGCYLNEVDSGDFDDLCKEYPSFQNAIDGGFIVTKSNKEIAKKQNENEIADAVSEAKKAQDKAQSANAKRTGAKTKKA